MNALSRRSFLSKSAAAILAAKFSLANSARAQPLGSNGDIRVAVVGCGIKGRAHLKVLSEMKGVRIPAICDVDQERLDSESGKLETAGQKVKTYTDIRKLLEDKDIDAVVLSTPNHWHALMTIWACQAGKDIYVEKPVSHDIWESRRMLEAAEKYGQIIQGGTQNRSNPGFRECLDYVRSGALGKIRWVHGIDYKFRRSMGRSRGPQQVPATVDYNLFQGPASMRPLRRKKLHYDWHWQWETGNGDMGNIAAHTIDNLRHIMGDDRQPDKVMSLGGRYVYDDDGETPNVHLSCFDYGGIPTYAEIRNIGFKPGVDYMDNLRQSRESCIVQCEEGYLLMGQSNTAYTPEGKRIQNFPGNGVKEHMANFIDAVRNQKASLLNCPLKIGVQAADLFHMANLSYRSGMPASIDEIEDVLKAAEHSDEALQHIKANLDRHGIDLDEAPLAVGSWMSLEKAGRKLKVHNPDRDLVAQALFEKRRYRKPFVVHNNV